MNIEFGPSIWNLDRDVLSLRLAGSSELGAGEVIEREWSSSFRFHVQADEIGRASEESLSSLMMRHSKVDCGQRMYGLGDGWVRDREALVVLVLQ